MTESELLERISQTLKSEIGPAVGEEYPKTQAYMAAVITAKLSVQIGLASAHESAEALARSTLATDLNEQFCDDKLPDELTTAISELTDKASLTRLIEALYDAAHQLEAATFQALLSRIRTTLRASIDREMEYSR